jgi:hypothetical protein
MSHVVEDELCIKFISDAFVIPQGLRYPTIIIINAVVDGPACISRQLVACDKMGGVGALRMRRDKK